MPVISQVLLARMPLNLRFGGRTAILFSTKYSATAATMAISQQTEFLINETRFFFLFSSCSLGHKMRRTRDVIIAHATVTADKTIPTNASDAIDASFISKIGSIADTTDSTGKVLQSV